MNIEIRRALLLMDQSDESDVFKEMIKETQFTAVVEQITQLSEIKKNLTENKYDLVFLDLDLGDSLGLNRVLRIQEILPDVPIIVLTNSDDKELSLASIQAGAQDFLVKGKIDPKQLLRTIQYSLYRNLTLRNIDESRKAEETQVAAEQGILGLPNQKLFLEYLQLMINKNDILKKSFALLLIEIHEIDKIIANSNCMKKDTVMKAIAGNMRGLSDQAIFMAHFSENEFAILFTNIFDVDSIKKIIEIVKKPLAEKVILSNQEYFLTYNIGVSVFPHDGDEVEVLIQNAKTALHKAVVRGVGECEIYSKQLSNLTKINAETILENDLQLALERKEFFLLYQPKINILKQQVTAVEALLRWNHPTFGLVSPGKFIPIAEKGHLIVPIGNWVLEEVARQYQVWKKLTQTAFPLRISVNISVYQFQQGNLVETIQQLLQKHQFPPECLELELTQSIFVIQPDIVFEKLRQLKMLNIKIAIGDSGQGHTLLAYLSHLPVDYLKLDMDFVQSNQKDTPSSAVMKSVIELAHSLNLIITAEGIETHEQFEMLKQQQCDEVQGYYFSKPVLPNFIDNFIANDFMIELDNR